MKTYSIFNKTTTFFEQYDYDDVLEVAVDIVIETYFSKVPRSEWLEHSIENLIKDDVIYLDDIVENYKEEFMEKIKEKERGYNDD